MRMWNRIRRHFGRRQFEAELAEEIRIHREMSAEQDGPAAFGSEALALEQSRAVWGFGWIDSLGQDFRYAFRGFRKSPLFALTVIGTIGLALGLNTTLFTVFNAYVLRPIPARDPGSLYQPGWSARSGANAWLTLPQYESLVQRQSGFSGWLAYHNLFASLEGRGVFGALVTGNYFEMLGVPPYLGRPILPEDRGAVIVLGYETWQERFAADPQIVGKTVHLRGLPFEVIGIAAPEFEGLHNFPAGYYAPLAWAAQLDDSLNPREGWLIAVGRIEPGIAVSAAKAALVVWASQITADLPPERRATAVTLESRATRVRLNRETLAGSIPIFVVFGLVLLIACANVSNMMLARALARQREIAIRVSLGAGRMRLVRQLLTESILLAAPAAIAGLLISLATVEFARRVLFATLPPAFARVFRVIDMAPDARVFGFILLAAVAATIVFGLVPALQTTRSRLVEANRGDFSSDYRPARMRSALVALQAAVCALLLISAAVVLRSEQKVAGQSTGFDTHQVLDLRMRARYQAAAAERVAEVPEVEVVAAAWHAPLYGGMRRIAVLPAGQPRAIVSGYNFVSEGYFDLFRIPILRGRGFTAAEAISEAPVVMVSQSAARVLWPGVADVLGQRLAIPPRPRRDVYFDRAPAFASAVVIGVVRDTIGGSIANPSDTTCLYFPTTARSPHNDSVLVRLRGDTATGRRALEQAIDRVSPSAADMVNPMDDVAALQVYPFQVMFWVVSLLGGLGLVLTGSGIYGVLSYLVSQRTKEIGIRVALGAAAGDLVRMVVVQSMRLASIGTAVGAGLALAVAPVFAHELEAVDPYDAAAYAAGAGLVAIASLLAAWAPTRRAVEVDPIRALRCD